MFLCFFSLNKFARQSSKWERKCPLLTRLTYSFLNRQSKTRNHLNKLGKTINFRQKSNSYHEVAPPMPDASSKPPSFKLSHYLHVLPGYRASFSTCTHMMHNKGIIQYWSVTKIQWNVKWLCKSFSPAI